MEERRSFTAEELALAKSVDLTAVAASLGYTVKKIGRYHTLKEMDSIRIYNRTNWFRWSREHDKGNNGGSQIDFLRVFAGMEVKEAVFWLLDFSGYQRNGDWEKKSASVYVEKKEEKGKEVECDYIHGKADISKNVNTSNLVLGIDEYLDDDKKDKELGLLSFKKFYQRIYKSTGNRYLEWVDEIKDEYADYIDPNTLSTGKGYPGHTLYIFGHSLDITDRDVLKMFICNENVQTKIFYYRKSQEDKTELGKLIRNLILIMGQEELIRRTGGVHKTIEFVPQTVM